MSPLHTDIFYVRRTPKVAGAKAEAVVAVAMMAATTFMVSFEQLVHVAGRWFVEAPGSSDSS